MRFPEKLWGNVNLWTAGVKVKVTGLENINNRGTYIFVSNHQGWFDIFTAIAKLPFHFSWLAKVELFKIPVLGAAMYRAGYISIDRSDRRKAMNSLNRAAEQIRQGTSVFIFPEGTRSADGVIRDFKKGWLRPGRQIAAARRPHQHKRILSHFSPEEPDDLSGGNQVFNRQADSRHRRRHRRPRTTAGTDPGGDPRQFDF